jgi:hypothetical protein
MESTWFILWVVSLIIGAVIVFGIFTFIIRRGNQRIAKEMGRTPLYKVTSSGRIGLWTYKGPFIQMRMYEDFLVIGYAKHIVLLYDEIDTIVLGSKIFRLGITIKHHCSGAPRHITLSSANLEKVVAVFEQYSVR